MYWYANEGSGGRADFISARGDSLHFHAWWRRYRILFLVWPDTISTQFHSFLLAITRNSRDSVKQYFIDLSACFNLQISKEKKFYALSDANKKIFPMKVYWRILKVVSLFSLEENPFFLNKHDKLSYPILSQVLKRKVSFFWSLISSRPFCISSTDATIRGQEGSPSILRLLSAWTRICSHNLCQKAYAKVLQTNL